MENHTLSGIGFVTVEQYLEFDAEMEKRYEYIDGVVREWNGGPIEPQFVFENLARIKAERERPKNGNRPWISSNLLHAMFTPLEDSEYEVWHKLPVETGRNRYEPQITVSFGEIHDKDDFAFDETNTRLVVEILSETITSAEFTERLNSFLGMASLKAYVLISQREPLVQIYAPLGRGDALYRVYRGLDAVVSLDCIGCQLKLTEIYRDVEFGSNEDTKE